MTGINTPNPTPPESAPERQAPAESGISLPPRAHASAEARAKWKELLQTQELDQLQKIQTEKDEKQRKADELRSSSAQRTAESWTNNKAEKPTMMGIDITDRAKAEISKDVDKEFAKKTALFAEIGLSTPENISAIKNVAKEIIFEHFTKTGAKESHTKNYVEKELVPKLEETFESLKAVYEQHKNNFESPIKFMETFSAFCNLEIINNGRVNEANIKTLLLVQKTDLKKIVEGFREYVPLNTDIIRLDKEAEALFETGRQRSGQPAPAETAPASTETTPAQPETVPASTDPAPTAAPTAAPAESAETGDTTAAQPETQPASAEINTGNELMDKILNGIKSLLPAGLFEKIMSWLEKFGLGTAEAAEFAGLTDPEKKEALILKEAANQMQLNEKVMAILYQDGEQVKKILADKSGLINTGWTEYLQQRLNPNELELLKKDPGMDTKTADKIAAIILSPATPTAPNPPVTS